MSAHLRVLGDEGVCVDGTEAQAQGGVGVVHLEGVGAIQEPAAVVHVVRNLGLNRAYITWAGRQAAGRQGGFVYIQRQHMSRCA